MVSGTIETTNIAGNQISSEEGEEKRNYQSESQQAVILFQSPVWWVANLTTPPCSATVARTVVLSAIFYSTYK